MTDVQHVVLPDARELETRILLSARIGDVCCHTTHLHWRVADGLARARQVVAIDRALEAIGGDLHVLGGDFNTTPDSDEIRYLRGLTTLEDRRATFQDAWHRVHHAETGPTWVAENPYTEELAFLERPRRLDYLFVSREQRNGRGRVEDARVVLDRPSDDGVWPSDHLGVLADVRV
jgi:endonuclease/exonuclease/phosphatase family metal-dependent hydrolase